MYNQRTCLSRTSGVKKYGPLTLTASPARFLSSASGNDLHAYLLQRTLSLPIPIPTPTAASTLPSRPLRGRRCPMAAARQWRRSGGNFSDEELLLLTSHHPRKRVGRKKVQETRHPVYCGVRRRSSGKWVCEVCEPNKN
ncbi:hypothetical protein NL676_016393 [Syzygium grande]|nr:hypothetical protein NL676_016393 [Syzygium grande]